MHDSHQQLAFRRLQQLVEIVVNVSALVRMHLCWTLHWKMRNADIRESPGNIVYDTIISYWKKNNALCLSNIVARNNEPWRKRTKRSSNDFNISVSPRRVYAALFNYLDYNAASRFADCAEVKVPSRSFNELGPLILVPKFLIIFPLLKAVYL